MLSESFRNGLPSGTVDLQLVVNDVVVTEHPDDRVRSRGGIVALLAGVAPSLVGLPPGKGVLDQTDACLRDPVDLDEEFCDIPDLEGRLGPSLERRVVLTQSHERALR